MRYGNQIVAAAKVKEIVPEVENEAQARPLVALVNDPPALQKAGVGGIRPEPIITAKIIKQAVQEETNLMHLSHEENWNGLTDERRLAIIISGKSPQKLFGHIRYLLNLYAQQAGRP